MFTNENCLFLCENAPHIMKPDMVRTGSGSHGEASSCILCYCFCCDRIAFDVMFVSGLKDDDKI